MEENDKGPPPATTPGSANTSDTVSVNDAPSHSASMGSRRLAALLSEYQDRPFLLVEPSGNYGDQLIFAGMVHLADRLGIRYRNINYAQLKDTDWSHETVVYIHGGGGFVPFWSGTPAQCVAEVSSRHRGVLVVGPSSYWGEQYLRNAVAAPLAQASLERAVFFCRELESYRVVEPLINKWAEVLLDHDTAFNLSVPDLERMSGERIGTRRSYVLYCLRRDREAADTGRCGLRALPIDPVTYCYNQTRWLKLHIRARRIFTNRLHSAIVGAILGKPTVLLPNNFHKAQGVFEMSLEQLGVEWQESLQAGWASRHIGSVIDSVLDRNLTARRIAGRLYFGAGV